MQPPMLGANGGFCARFRQANPSEPLSRSCPTPKFRPGALYHPMCELSSGNCCTTFLAKAWGAGKMAIDALKALRENLAHMDGEINEAAIAEMDSGNFAAFEEKARAAAATEPAV